MVSGAVLTADPPGSWGVQRVDGHELDPELLHPFDDAVQLGLIAHRTGENGGAVPALHAHAVEQHAEVIAELAAHDELVGPLRRVRRHRGRSLAEGWVSCHHLDGASPR
jgi:hypothetical protein